MQTLKLDNNPVTMSSQATLTLEDIPDILKELNGKNIEINKIAIQRLKELMEKLKRLHYDGLKGSQLNRSKIININVHKETFGKTTIKQDFSFCFDENNSFRIGSFDKNSHLTKGIKVTENTVAQGTFDSEGKLHSETQECIIFSEEIVSKGQFIHGSLYRGTIIYYAYGIEEKGQFKNDVLIEGTISYSDSGHEDAVKEESGTFDDEGRLHGENCKRKYYDGTVQEGQFKNGNLIEGTISYSEGDVKEESGTFDDEGRLHGENCKRKYYDESVQEGEFQYGEFL